MTTLLDYLQQNNYTDIDTNTTPDTIQPDTLYLNNHRGIIIGVSHRNDEYNITYMVGNEYETYVLETETETVSTLMYLKTRQYDPTPNDIITIHRDTNRMVNLLNEKSGNVGRFRLPNL